jgi:hypothetical protein
MGGAVFDLYTIYENPRDYPGKFVVRRWVGLKPDPTAEVRDTLADARAAVPVGRVLLSRMADDDPCIAETWI